MSGSRLSRLEPEVGQQLTGCRASLLDDSATALLALGSVCLEAIRQLVGMAQRNAVTTGNLVENNAKPFWHKPTEEVGRKELIVFAQQEFRRHIRPRA